MTSLFDYDERSVKSRRWRAGFGLVLSLLLVAVGCGREDGQRELDAPVVLIGIDGLEWRVMLPMIREGRLPNMTRLMERGSFGRLRTMVPTLSPMIWTSVATGKGAPKHGINHFVSKGPDSSVRLLTNRDRATKAIWNIFSDFDRTVHCIGWWMTFPAEEVNGTMVAQTNTTGQIKTARGNAIWKGAVLPGLDGQVYPVADQARVMDLAEQVQKELPELTEEVFGAFKHPHSELTRRLWKNTLWAFRADTIYARLALERLAAPEPFDLFLVYFGGPDVVGHRFWRYHHPEQFSHQPTAGEIANFSNIIRDYYIYVDSIVGTMLEALPEDAVVFIVSDHGMHAANQTMVFDPDLPPIKINSGAHEDGPPGVIIAAGGPIPRRGFSDELRNLRARDLPLLGGVLDIAPTLLVLKGLPVGSDMDGVVLQHLFEKDFLDRHPASFVSTHDTQDWLASRSTRLHVPEVEQERIEQLRALGYLE